MGGTIAAGPKVRFKSNIDDASNPGLDSLCWLKFDGSEKLLENSKRPKRSKHGALRYKEVKR